MSEKSTTHERYEVSNIGYGWAVHDTSLRLKPKESDPDKGLAPSRNRYNGPVVAVCSTREQAFREAARLNAEA